MEDNAYDIIVVGAGIFGCNAAYQLLKHGCKKVLLLEKFHLPHTRGSSAGPSRVKHNCHTTVDYAQMMREVNDLWTEIEDESNTQLLWRNVGEVCMIDSAAINEMKNIMQEYGFPHEKLDVKGMKMRLPHINVPDDAVALWDPEAAVIKADKCISVLLGLIKKLGGKIVDSQEVEYIKPGNEVEIITSKGKYKSKSLVLTPGPWINELLSKTGIILPVQTSRGYHIYWKEKAKGTYSVGENFPLFCQIVNFPNGYKFYAVMPSAEYPGMVKVAYKIVPPAKYCHPDDRDASLNEDMASYFKESKEWKKKYVPGIEDNPSIDEPCICTISPDNKFIIDSHPRYKNIIIGAAGSGNGFMMSPIVGKLLCQLALGLQTSYDLKPFRINRFNVSKL